MPHNTHLQPRPTEGVDWRGGCGVCVAGWILAVHGPEEVVYEECPCSGIPQDEDCTW